MTEGFVNTGTEVEGNEQLEEEMVLGSEDDELGL